MNSRAIVVGTGESLLRKCNGYKIDEFDCVIRSSNIIEFDRKQKYIQHTGKKTDIFWFNYSKLYRVTAIQSPASILCLFDDPDSYSDFFLYKRPHIFDYLKINRQYYDRITSNDNIIARYFFSKNEYCQLSKMLKIKFSEKNVLARMRPSAGMCAVFFAINNFDDVYITGFDGFTSNFYYNTNSSSVRAAHNGLYEQIFLQVLIKKGIIKLL